MSFCELSADSLKGCKFYDSGTIIKPWPMITPMIDLLKEMVVEFEVDNLSGYNYKVGNLRSYKPPKVEMTQFIDKNNWRCRDDQILGLANHQRDAAEDQE